MKILSTLIAALLCTGVSVSSFATENTKNHSTTAAVSTAIVFPPDIIHTPNIASKLKDIGINHATVYISWHDSEREPGNFDFSEYHTHLDNLTSQGLSLILVLDMGGRQYIDHTGKVSKKEIQVPNWMVAQHPDKFMHNFSGHPTNQLDFSDPQVQAYGKQFISQATAHFQKRYHGKILGFAIGLQDEHEIKYGQTGYQWQDYSPAANQAFSKITGQSLPVINYNNNIAGGLPKSEPLLHAHKNFREDRLRDATCTYAQAIREQGGAATGYFAELFTSHDAIYATGITEKVASCLDIAVIDYNFYDGYNLVPDPWVLPMLANYMASVGYQKIIVGAYAERWESAKKTASLLPVIQESIVKALAQPNVIGYEVGGLQRQEIAGQIGTIDLEKMQTLRIPKVDKATPNPTALRIGILASTSNFYVWHGERSLGINPHRDALLHAYRILSSQPDFAVHVIGEKNLEPSNPLLNQLDAIFIPHQAALPAHVKTQLQAYWEQGGSLIQDMRLGEFDENGHPSYDWMHQRFGIAHVEWKVGNGIFLTDTGTILRYQRPRTLYTGYAALTPQPGYTVHAKMLGSKEQGILLRGPRTLVFGLMPQLVQGPQQAMWQQLFVREIRNTVEAKKGT